MPIKPENAKRYPVNWKELRTAVLARAEHRCENCGVPNHWWKDKKTGHCSADRIWHPGDKRDTLIVLTIAHLEHDELETQDISRLRAWCQKCHLTYDAKHHAQNAAKTRHKRKAIGELFE
jgi:5-methylcytosine-specific restriction endonuclease McrA